MNAAASRVLAKAPSSNGAIRHEHREALRAIKRKERRPGPVPRESPPASKISAPAGIIGVGAKQFARASIAVVTSHRSGRRPLATVDSISMRFVSDSTKHRIYDATSGVLGACDRLHDMDAAIHSLRTAQRCKPGLGLSLGLCAAIASSKGHEVANAISLVVLPEDEHGGHSLLGRANRILGSVADLRGDRIRSAV